jgi:acetyltransferase-like isoleucine patch superfamily enzyme
VPHSNGGREQLKALARAAATVLALPSLISFAIRRTVLGPDRALLGSTQALSLIPGVVGQYVRTAFLRRVLAHCAPSAAIEFGTIFSNVGARIDDHVYIGPMCHIGLAHLEHDVLIGAAVHIPSGPDTHGITDLNVPIREQPGRVQLVTIGAGSWIASGAIVMADVGPNSVIGAGSVVTKPLEGAIIAAGAPARVVRSRV